MSKYIDAEKLTKKINLYYDHYRLLWKNGGSTYEAGLADGLDVAEQIIDSLQQEQPSLPDNLDEAAQEYAETKSPYGKNAFKAEAEWMAGQGVTVNGYITDEIAYSGVAVILDNEGQFKPGEEVIVQIRKK